MLARVKRLVPLAVSLAVVLPGCGGDAGSNGDGAARAAWGDREPVIYSVVVAEVLDDVGTAPPVVYVVGSLCADAGQVSPSELACSGSIPAMGRTDLQRQLERYAPVRFVDRPEAAVGEDGTVRDGGLLFWFGPLAERNDGEVRVGANYTSELDDRRSGAVNLALDHQDGSWVVTGAAGLGGCPA
jgi:hypothetical protein